MFIQFLDTRNINSFGTAKNLSTFSGTEKPVILEAIPKRQQNIGKTAFKSLNIQFSSTPKILLNLSP